MLSTVPRYSVGAKPTDRHSSTTNWLNSGARCLLGEQQRLRGEGGDRNRPRRRSGGRRGPARPAGPGGTARRPPRAGRARPGRARRPAGRPPAAGTARARPASTWWISRSGYRSLDLAQDLRHRVVAGVDDADPQRGRRRRRARCAATAARSTWARICRASTRNAPPAGVSPTWWVVRSSRTHAQLTLQALQLLAQRGLDDVLAGGRPAEVQLLGQGDEVAQLAKLHPPPPLTAPAERNCGTSNPPSQAKQSIPPGNARLISRGDQPDCVARFPGSPGAVDWEGHPLRSKARR